MIAYHLKARLAAAKTKAAANVEARARVLVTYPNAAPAYLDQWPLDWRPIAREAARRRYAKRSPWNPVYVADNGEKMRWLESVDGSGLVVVCENATAKVNRNTTGYYVDTFQEESQHGVVLATRDAESPRARFFAAINDPHNDGAYRLLWRPFDDIRDARAAADSMAESDAEKQREHDAAWQAGRAWADKGEEIKGYRSQALAILRDRKGATGSATLCAVIREKVESLLESISEARKERARLANGDSASFHFYSGDKALQTTFCEGADINAFPA